MHLFDIFAGTLSFVVEFHRMAACACVLVSIFTVVDLYFFLPSAPSVHVFVLSNRMVHDPQGKTMLSIKCREFFALLRTEEGEFGS